jgi:hypothetical protein
MSLAATGQPDLSQLFGFGDKWPEGRVLESMRPEDLGQLKLLRAKLETQSLHPPEFPALLVAYGYEGSRLLNYSGDPAPELGIMSFRITRRDPCWPAAKFWSPQSCSR